MTTPHHTTPDPLQIMTTPHQKPPQTTPHGVVLPIYACVPKSRIEHQPSIGNGQENNYIK
jgi:hypothetical protein